MIHLTKSDDIGEVTWYGLKSDPVDEEDIVCLIDDPNGSQA